ncbi:hypothetical protein Glove_420g57 [Diversispora epigaea]|uniref:Flavodoxin-like domain-containing protein n=1 Tax=Diversispora epigaea TaxID=1348612 RepID=A0A397H095_9GLOM|nr:hypothetical protein Glove_420g57 [Diversispora epigaea]
MTKIFIVIYTTYTHIYQLALEVKKGVESDPEAEVELFQVPETLPQEVLTKMHAPPKPDIPIITAAKLAEADGFLFGFPTRFGTLPAQFQSFLDSTGQLWSTGALKRKFGGFFFSTSGQHGGQETTAFTSVTYFAHHGVNFVPLSTGLPYQGETSEVIGGSFWGSGTITGSDASRPISEKEKEVARVQGKEFVEIVGTYVRGTKVSIVNDEISVDNNNNYTNNDVSTTTQDARTRSIKKEKNEKKKKRFWICCKSDSFLDD